MHLSHLLLATLSASSLTLAAPPSYDASTVVPAAPLYSWLSESLTQWIPSSLSSSSKGRSAIKAVDAASEYATTLLQGKVNPFDKPDYSDYSIWEVIQENEHLTDLKKVLKYSGPKTKDLLDDKSKKLTFLAPINWHHDQHHDEAALAQWSPIQAKIDELENESLWSNSDEDKDRKEKKKRAIAYLIDSTIKYHLIESGEQPLKAWDISQNSSVSTLLNIGNGKAKEIVGNLWDGEQFRLRVGKSLLPVPSAYFNFYSRLIYPDVDVSGSIVHAISFPLLIPPSTLQSLFFGQTQYSSLTSALQKVHAEGYFKLPINSSYMAHHHGHDHDHKRQQQHSDFGLVSSMDHHHDHQSHSHGKGQGALTLFAPSNGAFARMPWKLRLFLFSPFGSKVLGYVLALHSLPKTIFFADFVHEVKGKNKSANEYPISASDLHASIGEMSYGNANVTEYTFDTACPKLHYNKTEKSWVESESEFEQVDVKVYRYTILPGGKGPLQTRISVNDVPVLFQDIATANGGFHHIERFIKPKGHIKDGLWATVAHQAEQAGFGSVDLTDMSF